MLYIKEKSLFINSYFSHLTNKILWSGLLGLIQTACGVKQLLCVNGAFASFSIPALTACIKLEIYFLVGLRVTVQAGTWYNTVLMKTVQNCRRHAYALFAVW